ncbi:MAG: Hvo_1808 family surface protein [Halorientalis sp.]
MDRLRTALALLVFLGAVTPVAGATAAPRSGAGADAPAQARADPATDRVGWEAGYWHDEPVAVDQTDGLSDGELDAYVGRAMARVEYLRDAEFEESVPVSVISRDEFQSRDGGNDTTEAFAAWNNQVWEALFVDGEDSNVQERLSATYGSSVVGFYSPGDDEIKIVTDSPDSPTIDNGTLVHELTHALQDQQGRLRAAQQHGGTQDADLAVDGVIEGEANYIETRYARRCGGAWDCVATPQAGSGGSGGDRNLGLLLVILQPYSDGPVYVDHLREQGGWAAVDAAFADPPESTEQVIHRTDEAPTPIDYEDRARNGWRTYDVGQNGSDTVGEASIYTMFWYQARTADADTVAPASIGRTDSPFDIYNYDARPSAGWANDRVFPYRRGSGEDAAGGYVWVTEWDTERDAREFERAYGAILRAHDATRSGNVWTIEDGRFADAFRVTRDGTRVTVVNGPTPRAVRDIRPPAGGEGAAATDGSAGASGDDDGFPGVSGGRAPGLGVPVALAALAVLAALAGRRRTG